MQIGWEDILKEGIHGGIPGAVLLLGYYKLRWLLTEFRPHRHNEKHSGQLLTKDGIDYPRSLNGGKE